MKEVRPHIRAALWFSILMALLVLAPTVYMLEVYDRVVNSRNPVTLFMLTIAVLGAFAVMEVLDWTRMRLMHQAGARARPQAGRAGVHGHVHGQPAAPAGRNAPGDPRPADAARVPHVPARAGRHGDACGPGVPGVVLCHPPFAGYSLPDGRHPSAVDRARHRDRDPRPPDGGQPGLAGGAAAMPAAPSAMRRPSLRWAWRPTCSAAGWRRKGKASSSRPWPRRTRQRPMHCPGSSRSAWVRCCSGWAPGWSSAERPLTAPA
jgi:hypothetical protein